MVLQKLTLDEVNEVLMNERKRRGLTELPTEFFFRVLDLEHELKERCMGEIGDPKMMAAREQVHKFATALHIIHEMRALKVMEMVKVGFVGGTVDQHHMTSLELALFNDLSAILTASRKISMGRPPAPPIPVESRPEPAPPQVISHPVPEPQHPPRPSPVTVAPQPEAPKQGVEARIGFNMNDGANEVVIALKDCPTPLACPDGRSLNFKERDFITVPVKMAEVMVKRGMARRLGA